MKITDKITITNEDNMLLMARYPDNYFDLAIVDPPYGIGFSEFNRTNKTTDGTRVKANKYKNSNWDDSIPSDEYFNELFRVSKHQVIWGGNYFNLKPTRCFLFWDKITQVENFSDGELAWTSFDKLAKKFTYAWNGLSDGIIGRNKKEKSIHPTQKPVALYKWILDKYAKEGDKILDTHLGSMSIAIACADYGFELVGCELDLDYYNAGIKRLQNHLSQTKINFDI